MNCPYANILGVPGQGVHDTRFLGLAWNDLLMTFVGSVITAWILQIHIVYSFLGWMVVAEILHIAFGVNTALLKMIGITPCNV